MTDSDTVAVLAVHNGWLAANVDLIAESMLGFFPSGDEYLQFNLNGWTYRGAHDKARLWRNLKTLGANIISISDTADPNVEIFGDVALLTSVGECELVIPSSTGALERSAVRFRNTEFYRRDDGTGAPDWRIWHMHVSEAAPEGTLKYVTE